MDIHAAETIGVMLNAIVLIYLVWRLERAAQIASLEFRKVLGMLGAIARLEAADQRMWKRIEQLEERK